MATFVATKTTRMKKLFLAGLIAASSLATQAQNPVKGDYGYLYCHMSDRGEWTAYAVSRDGYHYQDILDGKPSSTRRSMRA